MTAWNIAIPFEGVPPELRIPSFTPEAIAEADIIMRPTISKFIMLLLQAEVCIGLTEK